MVARGLNAYNRSGFAGLETGIETLAATAAAAAGCGARGAGRGCVVRNWRGFRATRTCSVASVIVKLVNFVVIHTVID